MTLSKRILLLSLLLLLAPLLIPAFAILLLYALCLAIYQWLWMCWFCWKYADRVFLICSRRRGWEAFLKNNAAPALPPRVTAVWLEAPGQWQRVTRALELSGRGISKPYLVLVTPRGLKFVPLNQRLQSLKRLGQVSAKAREAAGLAIEKALEEFAGVPLASRQ